MGAGARLRRACGLAVLACLSMRTALAHADQPPAPHDVWTASTLDPLVIGPIAVAAVLYSKSLHQGWQRAGFGRGVTGWQALALVWPLDAMGDSLFAAHMAQHIVLMSVAAPLLVLGAPLPTMLCVLPRPWQRWSAALVRWRPWRTTWRWLTAAMAATLLQQVALWGWHAPAAIAASLRNDAVHALMHASLLATALLFWFAITRPRDAGYGRSILALLVTAKLSAILGALLTFAPTVLYPAYGRRGVPWGFSPLEDQQLAGLLMMTPGAMMYVLAGVVFVAVWLGRLERARPPIIGEFGSEPRRPAAEWPRGRRKIG